MKKISVVVEGDPILDVSLKPGAEHQSVNPPGTYLVAVNIFAHSWCFL